MFPFYSQECLHRFLAGLRIKGACHLIRAWGVLETGNRDRYKRLSSKRPAGVSYPDVLQVPADLLDVDATIKGHPAASEEPGHSFFQDLDLVVQLSFFH